MGAILLYFSSNIIWAVVPLAAGLLLLGIFNRMGTKSGDPMGIAGCIPLVLIIFGALHLVINIIVKIYALFLAN